MTRISRIPRSRRLTGVVVLGLMVCALPAVAAASGEVESWTSEEVQRMIVDEAISIRTVPASLALAVAEVESGFAARAVNVAGAIGVMQLLPATMEREFGVSEAELWAPATNVRLGLHYLARLYWRYDGDWRLALSHYRGGPLPTRRGRYEPHGYTDDYVYRVTLAWRRYQDDPTVQEWLRQAYGQPRFSTRNPYGTPDHRRFVAAVHDDTRSAGPWLAVTGDRFR